MAYQVLARKWRPQTFDDVLGQQAITRTLKNALKSKRIAQAFVLSGPRGCGKTTTARILARALSCVEGPTPQPCGVCDACIEIAEGRDIDVLEIDAATHTGVDNVREVIVEGLAIAPVRNRYKVFIIDEVHMLSASSFNALLKSIEEPPPHVIFMMATTEQHKIPDTVLSRSQVYEFRTISAKVVADRLRLIASEEKIEIPEAGLLLLARAGEGSMRDSLSAFDQVRALAGDSIVVEDIVTVLGLVGRDLVFDMLEAVVSEDAPAAFALVERAIERGYDLRLLCRELARATRDLLILSVDPKRASDPDVAAEAERERLLAMAGQWSREDLLRGFDLLTRTEQEVRISDQPRYNLEMGLLRLMHLRKLVPLGELLGLAERTAPRAPAQAQVPGVRTVPNVPNAFLPKVPSVPSAPKATQQKATVPAPTSGAAPGTGTLGTKAPGTAGTVRTVRTEDRASDGSLKDTFLAEIKAGKSTFYNLVVASAYSIDVTPEKITFAFQPNKKNAKSQCDDQKAWLGTIAEKVAGRPVPVSIVIAEGDAPPAPAPSNLGSPVAAPRGNPDEVKAEAMANATVQAVLEIFPVDKTTIEER
ncbi:MAG: DNA polymerase III subunit gamma/tau [Acidobacteria bacterium]|nr:DNA polymerase III subunit gamma/tau [Acidobacteriota bacterium]